MPSRDAAIGGADGTPSRCYFVKLWMNVPSCFFARTDGKLLLNGTPQSLAVIADVVAFVSQNRAWIRLETMSENMRAGLRSSQ